MRRLLLRTIALLCLLAAVPAGLPAQGIGDEVRLLRAAAARESAGDLDGAESLLQQLLTANPTSDAGLLGLERVLQEQGRREALLEPTWRFLELQPASPVAHQVLLRTYDALNRVEALGQAAEAWMTAAPRDPIAYRVVASLWRARGRRQQAMATLERGRAALGDPAAFALELGDMYATDGRYSAALAEWDQAIGASADGYARVKQRLRALPDGGMLMVPALLDRLNRAHPTPARRRAAVDLAMEMGMVQEAREGAALLIQDMDTAERQAYLAELGHRADTDGLRHLAFWAYRRLVAESGPGENQPLLRARIAELALALGDTAAAGETYGEIASQLEPGSKERRNALALRIELLARRGDAAAAADELTAFRSEFPRAVETDRLAAGVARAWLARDEPERAAGMLEGVAGPTSALIRGMLALRRGRPEEARAALMEAAPGLDGPEATAALELAHVLGAVSEATAHRLAAVAMQDGGARKVLDLAGVAPAPDRPALLDYAGSLADREMKTGIAEVARRRLIQDHPDAPETPAALLALARVLGDRPDGAAEAVRLLERLILDHPDSPLLPRARQELSRLRAQVPSGNTP